MPTMGERIKASRESKGLLQSQLAKMIDVKSAGVISNWEKDISKPDANKIVRLCKALNISVSYLLDYYGTEKSSFLSLNESEIIKKYRSLDPIGQEAVQYTLNHEIERMQTIQKQAERIAELESKQNPSEAYTLSIAARDGGDTVVLETPEERESRREATLRDLETIPDFSFDE